MIRFFRFSRQDDETLDQALADWRRSERGSERLSAPARERILEAAGRGGGQRVRFESAVPLFLPARRFALATVLPLLILSVAAGYLLLPAGPAEKAGAPRLLASRQGEEVVFVIANGDRPHTVSRVTDPRGLEAGEPVAVEQGVFRDRADSGEDLVFYRID